MAACVVLLLAGTTACLALSEAGAGSLWRHAYHAPVVLAALRWGMGGVLAAVAAGLLYTPFVLPALERQGPSPAVLEGLVTLALVLGVGVSSGALAAGFRRERARHDTLVAVQRTVDGETSLELTLVRLRACLEARLGGAVGLAVRDRERVALAGAAVLAPGSPAARVLATGAPLYIADLGGGGRPRRAFVAPLVGRGGITGALALERCDDVDSGERRALLALATHVGLALENARLAARQRRFAEELAEKVTAATRHVVEMDRMKSAFVAIASHERRAPLTALQGCSELLATRGFAPSELARVGAIMNAETERLGRIVADFLALARRGRGLAPPLRRMRVDAGAVVTEAVEVLRRARTTHALEFFCQAPLPTIEADP